MTKRPEENDVPDMEAGMTTAERRRRRRRGGGLRVPSDNVPRRSGSHGAVSPVGEDPSAGVSIAYSFSSEASGPVLRSDAHELPETMTIDVDDDDDEATVAGGIPGAMDGDREISFDGDSVAEAAGEDLGFDGKTREMPALRLPMPFGGAEVLSDADGEVEPTVDEELEIEAEPPPRASVPGLQRASTVALSEDDLEELVDSDPAMRRAMTSRPTARRPMTSPPAPPERAVTSPGESRRARTEDGLAPTPARHVSQPIPTLSGVTTSPGMGPGAVPVVQVAPAGVALPSVSPALSPAEPEPEPDPGVVVAAPAVASESHPVVELDDDDLEGEVVQPTDAADSGEILADELVEEVEAQSAQPVQLSPALAVAEAAEAARPAMREAAVSMPERPSVPSLAGATASMSPAQATAAPAAPPPAPQGAAGAATVAPPPPTPSTGHPAKPPPAPKKGSSARVAAVAAAVAPDGKSRKKKRGKPWFEEIFDEDYLRTLPFLTPHATQNEAQFVIDTLGLSPGAQVLDLGCGYGRHAMELAARGYHVVGLDLSLPLLLRGADEAQRRGLSINFVHGDMRELDFDSQFDGAYCLFSTFGYFDDEANKKTVANLARALKPGARTVIEVLNRDYLVADLPTRVWWEGDGCVVLEEVEFNYFSSRVSSSRSVVFDDGRQLEQEISIRAYSLHELGKLLHAAGFRVLEVSGSMVTRGRFFGNQSRHIIVVAERRPKDATETTSKA